MTTLTTFVESLSDDEMHARIVAAGATVNQAHHLVTWRDDVTEPMWAEWLGEP